MKTVDIGRIGEKEAAKLLKKKGFKILERNIHISHNEIDIIALKKKENILAFVEVKTRTVNEDMYSSYGTPAGAVTKKKQQRTIEAARGYISTFIHKNDLQLRFDVVEVYLLKASYKVLNINYIENAFGV